MQEPLNGGSLENRRCSKCEQSLFLLLNGINIVQLLLQYCFSFQEQYSFSEKLSAC